MNVLARLIIGVCPLWSFNSATATDTVFNEGGQNTVGASSPLVQFGNSALEDRSAFEVQYHAHLAPSSGSVIGLITSPQNSIRERITLVHNLSTGLSVPEVSRLYAFLKALPAKGENLPALHYLKNEIFTKLREQNSVPENLTDVMIGISEDNRQDLATRDYALQHLAIWCEEGVRGDAVAVKQIKTAFVRMAQQPNNLAATALLGLHRIQSCEVFAEKKEIDLLALRMVEDKEMPDAARMTAMAICGERKVMQALETIERMAQDSPLSFGMRISAVGALGRMGKARSRDVLHQLQSSEQDPAVRFAIVTALKRLEPGLASRGPL